MAKILINKVEIFCYCDGENLDKKKSRETEAGFNEIACGFGGPSEKKCQSLAKSAQMLLVMSDRTDKFRELCKR